MTFTLLVENIVRHRGRQCILQLVALDSRQSRADTNGLRQSLTNYEAPPIDHHHKVTVEAPIVAYFHRTLDISAEAKGKRIGTTPGSTGSKLVCKRGGNSA